MTGTQLKATGNIKINKPVTFVRVETVMCTNNYSLCEGLFLLSAWRTPNLALELHLLVLLPLSLSALGTPLGKERMLL